MNKNLSEKSIKKILDFVEQLQELDTKNIKPVSHAIGIKNIMREDKIKNLEFKNVNSGKYFKTKKILN